MKKLKVPALMTAAIAACLLPSAAEDRADRPNVVIIHTDEHNLRTLWLLPQYHERGSGLCMGTECQGGYPEY